MNPPTDVGKRELPPSVRSHFTELFVDEVEASDDLLTLVRSYVPQLAVPQQSALVTLYTRARKDASAGVLSDGNGARPRYTLRTLARALYVTRTAAPHWGLARALHEGAALAFLTQLDTASHAHVTQLIHKHVPAPASDAPLPALPLPGAGASVPPDVVCVEGVWLARGPEPVRVDAQFILTATVARQLRALARLVAAARYPVLLQGPTSAGKTSVVQHLARLTGHRCVRINNHEHTDLQEYLGQYVTDADTGALRFHEGALVRAVREGHWLILDELNLAPSDVLEALNRLLDDNRELYVPETHERLTPHPHFMLFATQNPSGLYGGRKPLSRAFRNRFVELHFEELSSAEVEQILRERCALPPRLATSLVAVMRALQRARAHSALFAGKHGAVTLRDLFRWAERAAGARVTSAATVAEEGFMLLAERLRQTEEREAVQRVLEKEFQVALDMDAVYAREAARLLQHAHSPATGLVWTRAAQRVLVLLERALRHGEAALLVGDTGVGKTSVALALAALRHQRAHVLNCHQHTETGDLLGALRPARHKERVREALLSTVQLICARTPGHAACTAPHAALTSLDARALVAHAHAALNELRTAPATPAHAATLALERVLARQLRDYEALFAWADGPLVTAMKRGDVLVLDEVSLAEDAVLERLNSVLEPARTLTLAEKGGAHVEELVAHVDFRLIATMNPGGDYGKKELSPALRNRFTEIWVPPISADADLRAVLGGTLRAALWEPWLMRVLRYAQWCNADAHAPALTLRDLLAWTRFLEAHADTLGPAAAFVHGASLVVLDALGMAHAQSWSRAEAEEALLALLSAEERGAAAESLRDTALQLASDTASVSRIGAFPLPVQARAEDAAVRAAAAAYAWSAGTTQRNLQRLVRALQVPRKAVLLEGSPGVGKTSLVVALAALCGQRVTRINLSEQTDMMDLLGADLPRDSAHGDSDAHAPQFEWRDGPFLAALQRGEWVLLDEINLASQSVLEGLNAVLDHRGTVYVPELGRSFVCAEGFRIFATQNPVTQGGGRKGLPRSFLNRFTKVYVDAFERADLLHIAHTLHPALHDTAPLADMVAFTDALHVHTTCTRDLGTRGAPWEFNLRDVLRWAELTEHTHAHVPDAAHVHADTLFTQRFRTRADRDAVRALYTHTVARVPAHALLAPRVPVRITARAIHAHLSATPRLTDLGVLDAPALHRVLQRHSAALSALQRCVQLGWPALLVGGPGSGKSTLVRALATLSGQRLLTMHLSAGMDASELLGSYEQVDPVRSRRNFLSEVEQLVHSRSALLLRRALTLQAAEELDADASDAALQALSVLQSAWHCADTRARASAVLDESVFDAELASLVSRVLDALADSAALPDALDEDMAAVCAALRARLTALQRATSGTRSGQFEWVDGPLVRAVREGAWLLLDNANLCAPAVLDRLNPLLERGGQLVLAERGLVQDALVTLTPHKNFRVFLTCDPTHGEVSRAMRNRALEIALLDDDDDAAPLSAHDARTLMRDLAPHAALRTRLVALHTALRAHTRAATLRAVSELGALVAHELRAGTPLRVALPRVAALVYAHASDEQIDAALRACFPWDDEAALCTLSTVDAEAPVLDADYVTHALVAAARDECALVLEYAAHDAEAARAVAHHIALRATPATLPLRLTLLERALPTAGPALHAYVSHAGVRALAALSTELVRSAAPVGFDASATPLDARSDDALVTELSLRLGTAHDWARLTQLSSLTDALWALVLQRARENTTHADTPLARARAFAEGALSAAALGSELLVAVPGLLRVLDTAVDALLAASTPLPEAGLVVLRDLVRVRIAFGASLVAHATLDVRAFATWMRWLDKLVQRVTPYVDAAELRAALTHAVSQVRDAVQRVVGVAWRAVLWKRGAYASALPHDARVAEVAAALTAAAPRTASPELRRTVAEALASLHAMRDPRALTQLTDTLLALAARVAAAPRDAAEMDARVQALAEQRALQWQLSLVMRVWAPRVLADKTAVHTVLRALDEFMAFALRVAGRVPAEVASVVRLRWLLERVHDADAASLTAEHAHVRITLWAELLAQLWDAQRTALEPWWLPAHAATAETVRVRAGPLALAHAALSAASAHTFVLDEERVSIAERDAHLTRVRALLNYLVHDAAAATPHTHTALGDAAQTWSLVHVALTHTLSALESEVSAPEHVHALRAVGDLVGSLAEMRVAVPQDTWRSTLAAAQEALERMRDAQLAQQLTAHTRALWPLLTDALSSADAAPLLASRAFVHVAQLRVALLLPSQPVHPRALAALRLRTLRDARVRVEQECAALSALERRVSDRATSTRVRDLEAQIADLTAQIAALELKGVNAAISTVEAQQEAEQFAALFASVQQLASTLLSESRVGALVGEPGAAWAGVARVVAHEAQWQRSVAAALARLHGEHTAPTLTALLTPLTAAVHELRLALRLHVHALLGAAHHTDSRLLQPLLCALLTWPSAHLGVEEMHVHSEQLVRLVSGCAERASLSRPLVAVRVLQSLLLRARLARVHVDDVSAESLHALLETYARLSARDEAEAQEREARAEVVVRVRERTIESDEAREERRFRELFPDYDGDYADLVRDDQDPHAEDSDAMHVDAPAADTPDEDAELREFERVRDAELSAVVAAHASAANTRVSLTARAAHRRRALAPHELLRAFHASYRAATELQRATLFEAPVAMDEVARAAHTLAGALAVTRLSSDHAGDAALDDAPRAALAFYTRTSPLEAGLLLAPLRGLLARVSALLEEFPDNALLVAVQRVAERVLALPLSAPLGKALAGVELVLLKAQQWNETAPSALSLHAELAPLLALVSRWRRQELDHWPRLLADKEAEFSVRAHRLWPRFFARVAEVCRADPAGAERGPMLAALLAELVRCCEGAPWGEFSARLALLRALGVHAALDGHTDVARVVLNVVAYYAPHEAGVRARIAEERAPLEKAMRDKVTLGRWEDRDTYRLKESATKARRHLAKLAHDYECVLLRPLTAYLETLSAAQPAADAAHDEDAPAPRHVEAQEEDLAALLEVARATPPAPLPASESASDADPDAAVAARAWRVVAASVRVVRVHVLTPLLATLPPSAAGLAALSASLLQTIAELRAITTRKQRPRKKRALVATLKQLQHMGLTWHRERLGSDEQREVAYVLAAHAPLLPPALLHAEEEEERALALPTLRAADTTFFRALAATQRARLAATTAHADLTRFEVQQASGLLEHALEMALQQRTALASALHDATPLAHAATLLAHAAQSDTAAPLRLLAAPQSDALRTQLSALTTVARMLAQAALVHNAIEDTHAATVLTDARDTALAVLERMESALQCALLDARVLVTPALARVWDTSVAELTALRVRVTAVLDARAQLSAESVAELARAWDVAVAPLPGIAETAAEGAEADACAAAARFVEEYQLAIQRLKAVCPAETAEEADEEKPEEEEPWEALSMSRAHAQHVALLQALAVPRVVAALQRVLATAPLTAPHVLAPLVPLATQLVALSRMAVRMAARYHRSHVRLVNVGARVLAQLFSEGFCSANERDAEAEDEEGDAEEGEVQLNDEEAGLGEGRGAKDVSDKLEDEEHALGEKPLREENAPQEELSDAEGVEMQNDFDGEMRDVEPGQRENEDDDEQDEESESLDKAMGETDARHEEIVDEKLWSDDDEQDAMDEEPRPRKELDERQQAPQGSDAREQELAANEDETRTKDLEEQGAPEKPPPTADDENEKDDGDGDGEGEGPEQDEAASDKYAVPPRAPDAEYTLPEDLNLDDAGDEDGGDGEGEEGEEGEEGAEAEDVQGEDAMDVDEDNEPAHDADEDSFQQMPEDEEEGPRVDSGQLQHEAPPEEDAQEDAQEEEEKDSEEEGAGPFDAVQREEQTPHEEAFGVDQPRGTTTRAQHVQRDTGAPPEDTRANKEPLTQGDDEQRAQETSAQGERSTQRNERAEAAADTPRRSTAPNPYRSLGDALQHWQRQLNVLEREDAEHDKAQDKARDANKDKEQLPDEDQGQDALFEHMRDDDEERADAQVLGIATEDQLQPLHMDKERSAAEEEEDNMDVDEEHEHEQEHGEEHEGRGGSAQNAQLASMQRPHRKEKLHEDEESSHEDVEADAEDAAKTEPEVGEKAQGAEWLVAPGRVPPAPDAVPEADAARDAERVAALRAELSARVAEAARAPDAAHAHELGMLIWRDLQRLTSPLAQELAEQLRLLLEPTLAAKLRGDYRTGKRLNMRKVIPYIASQFRKDKIWLRRTQPSKREYQVLLAVDDSESVALGGAGELVREALAVLIQALTIIEVGQLAVARFGADVTLLHALDEPWSDARAATVFPQLAFTQQRTDLVRFLERAVPLLETARSESRAQDAELRQLLFIVGDGRFGSERAKVRRWLRRAHEAHMVVVYLAIDTPLAEGTKKRESLLDIQSVAWTDGKMSLTSYMDDFPFDLYLIVRDAAALPRVLADALRQWFELSASAQ